MNSNFLFVAGEIALGLNEGIRTWLGHEYLLSPDTPPQITRHLNSLIIRYEVTGPRKTYLLAKIPFKPSFDNLQAAINDENLRKAAREEYLLLIKIQKTFGETPNIQFDTIHALAYLEPWNAILMEEVTARSLLSFIHKPYPIAKNFNESLFIENLKKATQWLKQFHQKVGGFRLGPLQQERLTTRYEKISKDCSSPEMTTRAAEYLPILKSMLSNCQGLEPIAQMHGDFHCNNILITNTNRVCVIDPRTNAEMQSAYHDLASLIVHLHYYQMRGKISKRFLQECQNAILETYFQPDEFSKSQFLFYCASEVLFKWAIKERDLRKRNRSRIKTAVLLQLLHITSRMILHRFLK